MDIWAIKEKATIKALVKRFGIAPMKVVEWKEELLSNAEQAFYNYRRPHQSLDVLISAMKYGLVA